MTRKEVKHTIYAVFWMIIWTITIRWGTTSVFIVLNDLNDLDIYHIGLVTTALTSMWLSGQKFLSNMLMVIICRAKQKETKNNEKEL